MFFFVFFIQIFSVNVPRFITRKKLDIWDNSLYQIIKNFEKCNFLCQSGIFHFALKRPPPRTLPGGGSYKCSHFFLHFTLVAVAG